ncbi:MAG: hypothetical protein ACLPUT_17375 [Solirubrobacteraceae bacterium]
MAGGIALVVLVEVLDVSRGLRDSGLVVGGALIGLLSLWLDEVLRTGPERRRAEPAERRNALMEETETNAAYYLGYATTALPVDPGPIDERLGFIRDMCFELGLPISEAEEKLLESSSGEEGAAETLSKTLRAKGQNLKPPLWCFFELGNTVAWLHDEIKQWYRTQPVLAKLESLEENPYLQLDPRYSHMVDELIKLLAPFRDEVTDEQRARLKDEVLTAVSESSPPVLVQGRNTVQPAPSTDWIWVTSDDEMVPMRIVGDRAIVARNADLYEVTGTSAPDGKTLVTRDATGWHCSAHAEATEQVRCPDIDIVLFATQGGKPVTEARVIPVRFEEVSPAANEPGDATPEQPRDGADTPA